jgi:hypothetical protein
MAAAIEIGTQGIQPKVYGRVTWAGQAEFGKEGLDVWAET